MSVDGAALEAGDDPAVQRRVRRRAEGDDAGDHLDAASGQRLALDADVERGQRLPRPRQPQIDVHQPVGELGLRDRPPHRSDGRARGAGGCGLTCRAGR